MKAAVLCVGVLLLVVGCIQNSTPVLESFDATPSTPISTQETLHENNETKNENPSQNESGSMEDSPVLDVHPTPCKPSHGFDDYRTDQTLAIHPQNPAEMLINVEFKGVYKTTDGGKTWNLSVNGLKGWPVTDDPTKPCYMQHFHMMYDPIDPSRVLLPGGSGPGYLSDVWNQTGGLHESLDGGNTWHQLMEGNMNGYTTFIAIDPRDTQIMYVGTAAINGNSSTYAPDDYFVTKGIVYKTIDGGANWEELPTGIIPHLRATALYLNPQNPDHLLLGTMGLPSNDGDKDSTELQYGILETTNAGKEWKTLDATKGMAVRYMKVAPTNFNHFFVMGSMDGADGGHYSLDGGKTIQKVDGPVNFVEYDPHDAEGKHMIGISIYAAPNDIYESPDAGATWKSIGKLPSEITNDLRVSNIVWDPKDPQTLYMNGDLAHVWKSIDGGKTWSAILSIEMLTP